jgi:FkbM family methyltransferase
MTYIQLKLKQELTTPTDGLRTACARAAARAQYLCDHFKKPEYLFRPQQLWRRCRRTLVEPRDYEMVKLPWGALIRVQPHEVVGRALWHAGVCDLAVSETLWRLIEPGETVVDVGANIGSLTALMAARVGHAGKVLAYEPHPEIFRRLTENIELWQAETDAPIRAYRVALSNYHGAGGLNLPSAFQANHGLATLAPDNSAGALIPVQVEQLDDLIHDRVGLLKLDIEGHELMALQGAEQLLSDRQIRDIVFEEHQAYPTPVTQLLEAHGYTIFNLGQSLWGLRLTPVREPSLHRRWDSRSCLATLDPQRALRRLQPRGWRVLHEKATT